MSFSISWKVRTRCVKLGSNGMSRWWHDTLHNNGIVKRSWICFESMLVIHFGRIASCLGFRSISLSHFPHPLTVHTESQTHVNWWVNNPVNICCQWQVMVRWDHIVAHTHKLTNNQHTNQACNASSSSSLWLDLRLSASSVTAWNTLSSKLLTLYFVAYSLGSPDLLTKATHCEKYIG